MRWKVSGGRACGVGDVHPVWTYCRFSQHTFPRRWRAPDSRLSRLAVRASSASAAPSPSPSSSSRFSSFFFTLRAHVWFPQSSIRCVTSPLSPGQVRRPDPLHSEPESGSTAPTRRDNKGPGSLSLRQRAPFNQRNVSAVGNYSTHAF